MKKFEIKVISLETAGGFKQAKQLKSNGWEVAGIGTNYIKLARKLSIKERIFN